MLTDNSSGGFALRQMPITPEERPLLGDGIARPPAGPWRSDRRAHEPSPSHSFTAPHARTQTIRRHRARTGGLNLLNVNGRSRSSRLAAVSLVNLALTCKVPLCSADLHDYDPLPMGAGGKS